MSNARPIRFKVEYAKTNRSSCSLCRRTLEQGKMRIGRLSPSPFHDGYITTWFHYKCFWTKYPLQQDPKKKRKVVTARSVKEIEGFDKLRMEDQDTLRKILNEKDDDETGEDNEENIKLKEQNKMEWELKDKLRAACRLTDLKRLISYNNLEVSGGQDTLIDQIAEGILYGIPTCPQCKTRGEMYFKDGLYRCKKDLEWGKCGYRGGVSSIEFEDWRIDPDCGIDFLLNWNKSRQERFVSMKQLSNRLEKIETYKRNPNAPLQSMKFTIAGNTERSCEHLKTIIIEHGGSFYDSITHDIDYVITTYEDLAIANKEIEKRKKSKLLATKEEEEGEKKRKEEEERKRKEEEEKRRKLEEEERKRRENEILTDRIPSDDFSVGSEVNDIDEKEEKDRRRKEEEDRIKKMEEERLLNQKIEYIEKIIQAKELGLALVTELIVDRLIKEFGFDQSPYLLEGKLPPIAFAKLDETSPSDKGSKSTSKYIQNQFNFGQVDPRSKIKNGVVYREKRITEDGKEITEIYDIFLTQSDFKRGSNKFYRMQIIDVGGNNKSFVLFLKWGRIGAFSGQQKVSPPSSLSTALSAWKEKYLEKTDNNWDDRDRPFVKKPGFYFPLKIESSEEVNDNEDDKSFHKSSFITIPSLLDLRLQSLIKIIFDQDMMKRNMIELEIDITRLPIHNISKSVLKEAYNILKEIEDVLDDKINTSDQNIRSKNLLISSLSNKFYTLIPHDFGMKVPELIDNKNRLKSKMKQIEILSNIEIASSFMKDDSSKYVNMNPIDINYKKLGCIITPLSQYSSEYSLISKCVQNGYDKERIKSVINVIDVYKVERDEEIERFNKFKNLKPRMLLWHGSRLCNFVGILSNGLRIAPPEAPASGYMFGKGIYFADLIQKSISYTHPDPNEKIGLLLLCEVALGDMYELNKPQYISSLPEGKNSAKALSKLKPSKFQKLSNGCLIPNGKPVIDDDNFNDAFLDEAEYIVYNESQVKIVYIVKVKIDDI